MKDFWYSWKCVLVCVISLAGNRQKQTQLLFLLAVNILDKTDLDNDKFTNDDAPDPEHIIPRETDQIDA